MLAIRAATHLDSRGHARVVLARDAARGARRGRRAPLSYAPQPAGVDDDAAASRAQRAMSLPACCRARRALGG